MYTYPPGRRGRAPVGPRFVLRHLLALTGSAAVRLVPAIVSASPGADPLAASRRAAVYVSFDRWNLVASHVVDQVAALADAGRRVTFVTNSARLAAHDADRLRPYVREIVHRRNFGHDFGAYKDGIARLGDLQDIDSLVLMNDSCFGPFGGLARVEAAALASGADLFGITESWSVRYHLQTYYVWIGAAALRSRAFRSFWRALLPSQPRSMVIANGEIALTQKLLRAGFTARALCPYAEVASRARRAADQRLAGEDGDGLLTFERDYLEALSAAVLAGADLNPTHSFWDVLVTDCGSPFIKRELLRHNPLRIPGVSQWESLLADQPAAQLDAIRDSLKLG